MKNILIKKRLLNILGQISKFSFHLFTPSLTLVVLLISQISFGLVVKTNGYLKNNSEQTGFSDPVCEVKGGPDNVWSRKAGTLTEFKCRGKVYIGGDLQCKEQGQSNSEAEIATPICLRTEETLKSPTKCARKQIPSECREVYERVTNSGESTKSSPRAGHNHGDSSESESEDSLDLGGEAVEIPACVDCSEKLSDFFKRNLENKKGVLCNSETPDDKIEAEFKGILKSGSSELLSSGCSKAELMLLQMLFQNVKQARLTDHDSNKCESLIKDYNDTLKEHMDKNLLLLDSDDEVSFPSKSKS